jgi:hypothetical protein
MVHDFLDRESRRRASVKTNSSTIIFFLETNLCPITPVLITSVESSLPTLWSVVLAMLAASSSPPTPVTALALPELTMTLRSPALALL